MLFRSNNQEDFEQTLESKMKDRSESPRHKMQLDPKEESSSDHLDQEQKLEITPGYGTIFGANRHWVWTRKKPSSLDLKENHRSNSPTNYLEKMKPSFSYFYLPLKIKEPKRKRRKT